MNRRDTWPLIGVLLIAAVTIALELLHTRILAILYWNHIVYLIVTVAMLGFGIGGTILALCRWPARLQPERLLGVLSLVFAATIVVSMTLVCRISIDFEHSLMSYRELYKIVLSYAVLVPPYILAGSIIAIAITRFTMAIGTIYFFNMAGSALGCFIFLYLIGPVGGETLLFLLALLAACASLCFNRLRKDSLAAATIAVFIGIAAIGAQWKTSLIEIRPERHKELAHVYHRPVARVEYTKWHPLTRVDVSSCPGTDLRFLTPTSIDYKLITQDGTANTFMMRLPPGPLPQVSSYHINCLAYALVKNPEVLVIGVGAGPDIVWGLERGARHITGVDINPVIIDVGKRIFKDFNGDIFNRKNVEIIESEGRDYVRSTSKTFDIIQMTGVDTFAALSSGAYVLSENYLYTVEAVEDYLKKLTPGGVLAISRWRWTVPREHLRLCSVGIRAFERLGVADPDKHIAVLELPTWGVTLFKKSPFTEDELRTLSDPAKVGEIKLAYPSDSPSSPYTQLFRHWRGGTLESFYQQYPYKVSPVYDDRPFFFEDTKWENALISEVRRDRPADDMQDFARGNWAIFTLLMLVLQVAVAVILFIIIPLLGFKKEGLTMRGSWHFVAYFLAIGIGFMFIEISFMQKLVLFLGHPIYSIALVLSSILLFSGLGSLVSGFVRTAKLALIAVAVSAIVLLLAVCFFFFDDLFRSFSGSSSFVKIQVSLAILAPLGFFMGMPFPSGLTILKQRPRYESLIPWAWGINAGASILASVISIIFAIELGFSFVMLLAAVIYALGSLMFIIGNARRRHPALDHGGMPLSAPT